MRKVTAQRLAEFTERDYVLTFGVGKREFDRMLAALEDAYRREHKRKPRFTKITMLVPVWTALWWVTLRTASSGAMQRRSPLK